MAKRITAENLPVARRSTLLKFIVTQLAPLVKAPPTGDEWLHELKFDGYRMLCRLDCGEVRFWSRNGKDWTNKFPNLSAAVRAFPVDTAIMDGEVVILDHDGRSNFQKLQHAIGSGGVAKLCFQAFDLIYLDGLDLLRVALEDRKRLLRTLFNSIPVSSPLRYSDHIEGNGALFFQHACQTGVEGIVSKLRTSHYDSARSRSWLKVKCSKRQEFVIAGYTDSSKGLPGFGALILGVYEGDRLIYAGRVGTGFSIKQRIDLKHRLDRFTRETSAL
jgi:bifunctional non-homologous end joining protein LigD